MADTFKQGRRTDKKTGRLPEWHACGQVSQKEVRRIVNRRGRQAAKKELRNGQSS